jgi:hypothetical protein
MAQMPARRINYKLATAIGAFYGAASVSEKYWEGRLIGPLEIGMVTNAIFFAIACLGAAAFYNWCMKVKN